MYDILKRKWALSGDEHKRTMSTDLRKRRIPAEAGLPDAVEKPGIDAGDRRERRGTIDGDDKVEILDHHLNR